MKTLTLSLMIFTAETTLIALHQDFDAKLRAISQIESNDNDKAKGRHGELSRYQLKRAVWKQHFPSEKDQRHIPSAARRCAKAHLCWLELRLCLAKQTKDPNPRDVYAAWNLGLEAFSRRDYNFDRLPDTIKQRAERFANLYSELRNNQ
jgi:hypothetical protein